MGSTIQQHLDAPEVSLDQHVDSRRAELALALESRQAIYLDIKFWILLRNVVAEQVSTERQRELLTILKERVASGLAFCPISESTFAELLKQSDHRTRGATAELIDELSLGVALIPFDTRSSMELERFISSTSMTGSSPPLGGMVWSKLSYVLGIVHPANTGFDANTELAVQKAFFDHMWDIPLSQMVEVLGDGMPLGPEYRDLADTLNAASAHHARDLRSFQQTYQIELRGALDLFAPVAADIARKIAERAMSQSMPREGSEWDGLVRQWYALLIAAFKKDEVKDALRTIHINTCLHAAVRWNKTQQLEANDFYDFHHAAAALGYCDVFLTERGLKSMVTAKHIALDARYACKVVASVDEAITVLRSQV